VLRTALLPRLDEWTGRRREIAERYEHALSRETIRCVAAPVGAESVWHLFPVRVSGGRRNALLSHLQASGVQAGVHYPGLIPDQPALAGREHRTFGALTNAGRFRDEEISLPIHPLLTDDEIDRVIEVVNGWQP
jgi:dTDP-3-amino-3,4,6-trideoxy-alpha-D-glucose transaminase